MAHTEIVPLPYTGLVKADLDLRLWDGTGAVVSVASVTVTETSDRHYTIAALPDGSTADPHTLTYRVPGVAGAVRWPTLESPPDALILALGVTGEAGTLVATLYRDAVEYAASLTITEPEVGRGDYKVTGLPDLSGEWKLVVESSLAISEVTYAGQEADGHLVTVARLKAWLGQDWTDKDDTTVAEAEFRAVSWLERETYRRLRTGIVSPVLPGPGHGALYLPSPITATSADGLPVLTSLETRGSISDDWAEVDLDDVEIHEVADLTTHELRWQAGAWPVGPKLIRPTYLTGYQATGSPATPYDLAQAVTECVAAHHFGARQATKRDSASFTDARFARIVESTIRRYTNPYKHQTLLDLMVV